MLQQILDDCIRRGTSVLNRQQFDENFAGHDLTIQIRAAIDFAEKNDLAFGRSTGDQQFVFSRLPKPADLTVNKGRRPPLNSAPGLDPRRIRTKKPKRSQNRPFGRSF